VSLSIPAHSALGLAKDTTVAITTDTAVIEWPKRLRTDLAAQYLHEVHGIPIGSKTLRNKRCTGVGPRVRYFGSIPLYDRDDLDSWAEGDALTDRSANRRRPIQQHAA